jgi:hypothetical protein
MNIMNKLKLKNLVLKMLLIVCAIGMTSTYIAIGKSFVFKSRIKTFTSLPLYEGQEYNVDMLKAKIESLESLNSIKEGLYSQIMDINQFSLIVSCVVFNLLFLVLILRLFFVKNQNLDNNCDTHN